MSFTVLALNLVLEKLTLHCFWIQKIHQQQRALTKMNWILSVSQLINEKVITNTPAAISQGFKRYSQYASTIPSAT